jgi:hypothetical protein
MRQILVSIPSQIRKLRSRDVKKKNFPKICDYLVKEAEDSNGGSPTHCMILSNLSPLRDKE